MEDKGKEPMAGKRGRMICPMCAVRCRQEDWPKFTEKERADNPNCLLYNQVIEGHDSSKQRLLLEKEW
eukprot:1153491-Prorocentrum_lima.AAC.1